MQYPDCFARIGTEEIKNRNITSSKIHWSKSYVAFLLYGCEWWTVSNETVGQLEVVEMWLFKKNVENFLATEENQYWEMDSCRCLYIAHQYCKEKIIGIYETFEQMMWNWLVLFNSTFNSIHASFNLQFHSWFIEPYIPFMLHSTLNGTEGWMKHEWN